MSGSNPIQQIPLCIVVEKVLTRYCGNMVRFGEMGHSYEHIPVNRVGKSRVIRTDLIEKAPFMHNADVAYAVAQMIAERAHVNYVSSPFVEFRSGPYNAY